MFSAQIVDGAAGVIQLFVTQAMTLLVNATRVSGVTKGIGSLVGVAFGRYDNGALANPPSFPPISPTLSVIARTEAAVAEMIAESISASTTLAVAGSAAIEAADLIAYPPSTLIAAVFAVAEALRNAINDPADQIRIMTALAHFFPAPPVSSAPIGQAIADLWGWEGDLARRAALISLARATAIYRPSSSDDARTIRSNVCVLLDAEILLAADQGDSQTYATFRALRTAVSADLTARGASLPSLATFSFNAPLPSLVLAYRLYQDATRATELTARVNPIMSLFFPTKFRALSS